MLKTYSRFDRFTTLVGRSFLTFVLLALLVAPSAIASELGFNEIERRFIQDNPTIRVANDMNWAPFNFNANGEPRGYVIDYMNLVAEKAGLSIEWVSGPTSEEFVSMFRTGTLDVIPNLTFNAERAKFARFTEKYVSLDNVLVSRKDKDSNGDVTLKSLEGKRLAVVKGDDFARIIKRRYPKVLFFEQIDALGCLKAVADGQADAAFGAKATYAFLAGMHFISDLQYSPITEIPLIKTSKFHIGVRYDWPILRTILQKGMNNIDYGEIRALHKKWLDQATLYSGGGSQVLLTQKEQVYLRDKQILTMVVDPDWAPFEYINDELEHTGLAADYLNLLSERIGIPIKLKPTETWKQSLQIAKASECDIVSMLNVTPERAEYLNFTDPYFTSPMVIVARKNVGLIGGLADMKNKIVAVVAGYWIEEALKRDHRNIHLLTAKNTSDALRMVDEGDAFATVATLIEASHLIQKMGFTDLKIVGHTQYENKLRIGVNKNEPMLLDILQKGVHSLGDKEKNDIFSKWMAVRIEHGFDYTLLWKVLGGVAVILLMFLYWNRKLSRLNDEIAATHKKVSLLLDNSGQGFLSFGKDLAIAPEFSQECITIFGSEMCPSANIATLLYPNDEIGAGNFDKNITRILDADDDFKRDLYLDLMQKEFRLDDTILEAEYKIIGADSMMLILTDITRQKALEDEVKIERNKLKFVVSAVRESRDFFDILDEFERFHTERLPVLLGDGGDPETILNEMYRQVHTFKGLFSQQDFLLLPDTLHDIETQLSRLQQDDGLTISGIQAAIEQCDCDGILQKDLDIIRDVLGNDFMKRRGGIAITQEQAEGLASLADSLLSKSRGGIDDETRKLLDQVRDLQRMDLRDLLAAYPKAALRLAENLEKEIKPFSIEGEVRVDPDEYASFTKALVHVFRNAVDHGIEDPIEREEVGKDEEARLTCSVAKQDTAITISIADDGRGLDAARLREQAVDRGIMTQADANSASDQDMYRVIFMDGFSTNEDVTDLSGRGVGLAAVLAELENLGGRVDIESETGKGTTFNFVIPERDA